MKRSCTSGPVLVKPQAMRVVRPSTISGMPGKRRADHVEAGRRSAPGARDTRSTAPPAAGADRWRAAACPSAVRAPDTTQLFEPPPSIGRGGKIRRERGKALAAERPPGDGAHRAVGGIAAPAASGPRSAAVRPCAASANARLEAIGSRSSAIILAGDKASAGRQGSGLCPSSRTRAAARRPSGGEEGVDPARRRLRGGARLGRQRRSAGARPAGRPSVRRNTSCDRVRSPKISDSRPWPCGAQLHLPQAVLGVHEAEREERVAWSRRRCAACLLCRAPPRRARSGPPPLTVPSISGSEVRNHR